MVDPASLPNLIPIRDRLPQLEHVVAVAGAREAWSKDWNAVLAEASPEFSPVATRATDPALLIYTSGTTGPPKGALMPQQCLLGNLPGFVHSHDLFPQEHDLFWSPADWAWTGGLMDALLPTMGGGTALNLARELDAAGVLRDLGPDIQWLHSYVSDDKITCVYISPNPELIREHAKLGGFPADRVLERDNKGPRAGFGSKAEVIK